jgi:SpoVK/Ycf46/Vps4 family AAA+-type ATPase
VTDRPRTDSNDLFEPVLEYPDQEAQRRYASLFGFEVIKERLVKEAIIRLMPDRLADWSHRHHGSMVPAAAALLDRPPVFILAGDVGTGKTALAETFGDPLARALGLPVFAYRLSLAARGSGLVGEITTLVRDAFATVGDEAKRATRTGKTRSAFILLIDEADSLAQSRQQEQMHHEDRAGVNALIRGIDELARDRLPAIIVLCTNRLDAIDPAVQRRSAEPFLFTRPNAAQREAVLRTYTVGTDASDADIAELVALTGPGDGTPGFTYSDLTQRLVPTAVLTAFPESPLTGAGILAAARETRATPLPSTRSAMWASSTLSGPWWRGRPPPV